MSDLDASSLKVDLEELAKKVVCLFVCFVKALHFLQRIMTMHVCNMS